MKIIVTSVSSVALHSHREPRVHNKLAAQAAQNKGQKLVSPQDKAQECPHTITTRVVVVGSGWWWLLVVGGGGWWSADISSIIRDILILDYFIFHSSKLSFSTIINEIILFNVQQIPPTLTTPSSNPQLYSKSTLPPQISRLHKTYTVKVLPIVSVLNFYLCPLVLHPSHVQQSGLVHSVKAREYLIRRGHVSPDI